MCFLEQREIWEAEEGWVVPWAASGEGGRAWGGEAPIATEIPPKSVTVRQTAPVLLRPVSIWWRQRDSPVTSCSGLHLLLLLLLLLPPSLCACIFSCCHPLVATPLPCLGSSSCLPA